MFDENEVGYGKPPKEHQFKKGQSGNRKGRRKGHKNMHTIMEEVLKQTVSIKENGQTRRVKYFDAFVRQLAARALNGSMGEQIKMLKAIHDYAPELLENTPVMEDIRITYVLPDGHTMEDYEIRDNLTFDTLDKDPKASQVLERPELPSEENDSWLD